MEFRKFGDRKRVKQHVGDGSLVQRSSKDECDINLIMKKYEKSRILTHVNKYAGEYGDFSNVPDYKTGLERVMEADAMFMSLPASIRDRFNNDPGKFIEFATNADNIGEMRSMGLAPKAPEPPEPQLVKVVKEPDSEVPPKAAPSKD